MTAADSKLTGPADTGLMKRGGFAFDAKERAYYLNKPYFKDSGSSTTPNAITTGNNSDHATYAAKLPVNLASGMQVQDHVSGLSLTLIPLFATARGKVMQNHMVYPLNTRGAEAVYTVKGNGLQEDVLIHKRINQMMLRYKLNLPDYLAARELPNGGVGIYSADPALFGHISYGSPADQLKVAEAKSKSEKNYLVFALLPSVIKSTGVLGTNPNGSSTKLSLKGDVITLTASGLQKLSYPISIDPSVLVTSATSFQASGNNEGDLTWGTNLSVSGLTGGELTSFAGTQILPSATYSLTSVAYNGRIYEIGGSNSSGLGVATVQYSIISNGSLGTWYSTTSLPAATYNATSVVYNGYLYEIGGCATSCPTATVEYAPILSNGLLGSWNVTTSLPTATEEATSVVYNGYVYEIGGGGPGSPTSTVDYAPIKSDGTLGTWVATTSLPAATSFATSVVYNGYVYEIGGCTTTSCTVTATVDYAPINADGTLGTWVATTSLPAATEQATSVVYNGYVYEIGGYTTAGSLTIDYAPLYANGTLGSWTPTRNLPAATYNSTSVVYNGYIYEIGGTTGSATASVYSTQVQPAGYTASFKSTTSLPGTASKGTTYYYTESATSVVYNGYVYEIGGMSPSKAAPNITTAVYYAPLSSNGIGTWSSTASLPTAVYQATSVVYNGYVYEIGGTLAGGTSTATVDYALICTGNNSGVGGCTSTAGTLGTWTATTSLPVANSGASSVVYSGYVYEMGGVGYSATVDYALICTGNNSGVGGCTSTAGTLGTWNTTTSLPVGNDGLNSVVSGGYIYILGGQNASLQLLSTVDYALICTGNNSGVGGCTSTAGTLGTWNTTTSLPVGTGSGASVVYNGYIYNSGGCSNTTCPNTAVYYAPINNDGTVGTWNTATSFGSATQNETSVAYNGYLYIIGGLNTAGTDDPNSYYAQINNGGPGTLSSISATTSLPTATRYAASVSYNGYVYEIGGDTGSPTATVDYAPINSNGTLGTWTATTSLPAATEQGAAVVYNGYVYMLGGCTVSSSCTTNSNTVYYAAISSTGTVGAWNTTTSLPTSISGFTSVVNNGYIYEIGGYTTTSTAAVYYAQISSTGAIGAWTSTTSLPATINSATSVAYNGYIYEIAGNNPTANNSVYYAPMHTDGTLGSWMPTTSLPTTMSLATSVAYNGYLYEIGGCSATCPVSTDYLAPINANGSIGTWTATTSLPAATYASTSAVYNGNIYVIGGYTTAATATVDYTGLQSIPRKGIYSDLVALDNARDVLPYEIVTNGTNMGNPGSGGTAIKAGGILTRYAVAASACTTFSPLTVLNTSSTSQLAMPHKFAYSANGCGTSTNLGNVVYLHYTLDDSFTASFPDVSGNHSSISNFTVYYRPNVGTRLRGGGTFANGSLQTLDAAP